jgi:hypothetical protein
LGYKYTFIVGHSRAASFGDKVWRRGCGQCFGLIAHQIVQIGISGEQGSWQAQYQHTLTGRLADGRTRDRLIP